MFRFARALSRTPSVRRVFSTSSPEAGSKAGRLWSTAQKAVAAVSGVTLLGIGGLYLQHTQTPDYKIDQAKKSVAAQLRRPSVTIKPPPPGPQEVVKGDATVRSDMIGDVPALEWKNGQDELEQLVLFSSQPLFMFRESGSGKSTALEGLADRLNGVEVSGRKHYFLYVPLRSKAGKGSDFMTADQAFAKACNVPSQYKDYAYDAFNAIVDNNPGDVVYHLILDDVQTVMSDAALKQWTVSLSGLIADKAQRLVLIGSEDVEFSLKKLSGASSRLKCPVMPVPTEKDVEVYLTKTIGLNENQAKRFTTEVGCYMGFITKFVLAILPPKFTIGAGTILKEVSDEKFKAAMEAANKAVLDKLNASKKNLSMIPSGKAAWKALQVASATFSQEVGGKNMDPQELKKRRRAILTSILLKDEDNELAEMLIHAKLIVNTGNSIKPEYDWYFVGYSKLAQELKV